MAGTVRDDVGTVTSPGPAAEDLEALARPRMAADAFDYIAGGADAETTLADNVAAWARLRLRPRMLRDVSRLDLSSTVLGSPLRAPVLVAPVAYQRLASDEGEAAVAAAAGELGLGYVLSTMASMSVEDVAGAAPDTLRWFQLYVHTDRELTLALLRRAEAAGYRALVLTVDTPVLGRRARHGERGFVLPAHLAAANLTGAAYADLAAYADSAFDASLTPEAISWLAERTSAPVVVKGILRGDDAAACVDAGAAAIIVSNHGGRQLDGAIATADALPEVVAAVGGRAEVYVDGGIRRGTDVLRALALGARAVLVGRPPVWGLALGGRDGARAVLATLVEQTTRAFALAGVRDCADVGADLIA
ncbi:MAG: alpha-hydroxy acid oxidase [bacterium]